MIKFLAIIFSLILIVVTIHPIYEYLLYIVQNFIQFFNFFLGLGAFIVVYFLLFSWWKNYRFIETLEHELVHAIFAGFFLKNIRSLEVSNERGGVVYLNTSNFIITLAPYFFPFYMIRFVILKIIVHAEYAIYIDFLIGFSFAFHIISSLRETRLDQPDIRQNGVAFSLLFIVSMHCLILSYFFSFTIYGIDGISMNTDFLMINAELYSQKAIQLVDKVIN